MTESTASEVSRSGSGSAGGVSLWVRHRGAAQNCPAAFDSARRQ